MLRRPHSIDEFLTNEVKSDLAERYFSFRKLIEEDKLDFEKKLRLDTFLLEKRISFDLIRIYILLKKEAIIFEFLQLAGFDEKLFYDPYLTESPTIRKRVFLGQRTRGFTRYGRFKDLVIQCYDRLELHVHLYHKKFLALEEDIDTINSEIALFYQKNDLVAIMGFLRSMDTTGDSKAKMGGIESGIAEDLDNKLKVVPLEPLDNYLPVLNGIAPLAVIKSKLKNIIKRAYGYHTEEEKIFFSTRKFPPALRAEKSPR